MGDVIEADFGRRMAWTDEAAVLRGEGWEWKITDNGRSRLRVWLAPGTDLWLGEKLALDVLRGCAPESVMAHIDIRRAAREQLDERGHGESTDDR